MPLPTPILDDRSFSQLRDELVRRIPVYAPEWTDHNPSDPGIALLELFAFLGENVLYRFNQIPEATKLAFLKYLQIPLLPATSARAIVSLTVSDPDGDWPLVTREAEAMAGPVPFELQEEVHVWPATVRAYCRTKADPPRAGEEQTFAERTLRALDRQVAAQYYRVDEVPADPLAPGSAVVDFGQAVDRSMWIAVVADREKDVPALRSKMAGKTVTLGFAPDEIVTSRKEGILLPAQGEVAAKAAHESGLTWKVSLGRGQDDLPLFRAAAVVADSTNGLRALGCIQVELPRGATDLGVPPIANPDLAGTGDLPPVVDDPKVAPRIVLWLCVSRTDRTPLGRVRWVGANSSTVVNVAKAPLELVGVGTAEANQAFALVNKPVVAGSLRLEVEDVDGWRTWDAVDDFSNSGPEDRHYVLDREAGQVRFGDTVRGYAPQLAQRIRAREYRYGGGSAGNVAAKAISQLRGVSNVTAKNLMPARGGADSEPVAQALDRIPGEIKRCDRAVTADDFVALAKQTQGWALGRAECLPLFHPTELRDVPGVVSVIVWPTEDAHHPSAPVPDKSLLRAVGAWLDARRLLTTELYVIPPTYKRISITVGLHVKKGAAVEGVKRWVELVIRQFLAPLPPYGPEGNGWPLGRRVIAAEIAAAALQVDGVAYLEGAGVRIAQQGSDGKWHEHPHQILLARHEVVELVNVVIVDAAAPPAPGDPVDVGQGGGGTAPTPLPVPTIKVEC